MNRFLFVGLILALVGFSQAQEPPTGFTPLFNGKDFTGWKQAADGGLSVQRVSKYHDRIERWKVDADGITYVPKAATSGHLVVQKEFTHYELLVDWKLTKGIAGIMVAPGLLKIWDDSGPEKDFWRHTGSGSLGFGPSYGKPLKKADKPLGEWNRFRIVLEKNPDPKAAAKHSSTLSIRLNDELIQDHVPKAAKKSPIAFQDHGGQISYRNIFIKELPD